MARVRRIVWSAEAVDDIAGIRAYIAQTSPRYADVVAGRLYDAVTRLERFPESGRIVPEVDHPSVRETTHLTAARCPLIGANVIVAIY